MLHLRLACAAALAVPFLAASRPALEAPTFHPREGLVLDKRFEVALEMEVDEGSIRVDGGTTKFETRLPAGMNASVECDLAVRDTYESMSAQRPLSLLRRFDGLELAWRAGGEDVESDALEEHRDASVRFRWNEKEQRYDASFDQIDGEGEMLAWFREDADLRGLLPARAVEVGASWNVERSALAEVLLPALSLDVLRQASAQLQDDETLAALASALCDLGKGIETECTWRGVSTIDGKRLGRIDVEVRGKPKADLAAALAKVLDGEDELRPREVEIALEIDGRGELWWDMDGGHFARFDLKSDLELSLDAEVEVAAGDERWTTAWTFEASGEGAWSYVAREP